MRLSGWIHGSRPRSATLRRRRGWTAPRGTMQHLEREPQQQSSSDTASNQLVDVGDTSVQLERRHVEHPDLEGQKATAPGSGHRPSMLEAGAAAEPVGNGIIDAPVQQQAAPAAFRRSATTQLSRRGACFAPPRPCHCSSNTSAGLEHRLHPGRRFVFPHPIPPAGTPSTSMRRHRRIAGSSLRRRMTTSRSRNCSPLPGPPSWPSSAASSSAPAPGGRRVPRGSA